MKRRDLEQVETVVATAASVMRTREFARGVADRRTGRAPDFDCGSWAYERGRLWASLAPLSMAVKIGGRLNPQAVRLFQAE
jgi:hypothetical protein